MKERFNFYPAENRKKPVSNMVVVTGFFFITLVGGD